MAPVSIASTATPSDSATFFTPPVIIAIVVIIVALLAVIATISISILVVRKYTQKGQVNVEGQDATKMSSSTFSGLFARTSSRTTEPELPWPVLQTLPHLRPCRERFLEVVMFWRKPKRPEPFTVADVLKAKLEVEERAQAAARADLEHASQQSQRVGWWKRSVSGSRRAPVVPEIVVRSFDAASDSDASSTTTVSPTASPASTISTLDTPMPIIPMLAASPLPAVAFRSPTEPQPAHVASVKTVPTLPTRVGLGVVGVDAMPATSSAAGIYHDANDFCRDLTIPIPTGIKDSISARDVTTAPDSSFDPHGGTLPPAGVWARMCRAGRRRRSLPGSRRLIGPWSLRDSLRAIACTATSPPRVLLASARVVRVVSVCRAGAWSSVLDIPSPYPL
ncbi:hypothetical protein L226DRAFT_295297 [Lentinus tigrinus ALCF2SS1-7]|uniref:uncharacterized protein n=1 Tax=Lentinus tigrinus ALCF2SS1-7 TaxID=1328758 RepID=UPI0011662FD5|nr:hypothetical protein L226DRAFT_295297 [Lentinus tigrinus ALCF2SS1-7]